MLYTDIYLCHICRIFLINRLFLSYFSALSNRWLKLNWFFVKVLYVYRLYGKEVRACPGVRETRVRSPVQVIPKIFIMKVMASLHWRRGFAGIALRLKHRCQDKYCQKYFKCIQEMPWYNWKTVESVTIQSNKIHHENMFVFWWRYGWMSLWHSGPMNFDYYEKSNSFTFSD